jgi:class 3 adenylate cyclase
MEPQIRFCTSLDGTRIAYATAGEGPPLVLSPGWVSHLKFAWTQPDTRAYLEGLARGRLLVRYDKRGTGLSDWDAQDFSTEARLRDLEAVVETLGLERFALMGFSEGGPTAIVYAARYPEKVSHLILYGSFHRWPHPREAVEPILALVRAQWGLGSAALSAAFVPSGDPAQVAYFTELERVAASAESASKLLEVNMDVDVTPSLKDIQAPTLVVHRRLDAVAPFNVAREMAALIPHARFEPLEGDLHPPGMGDSAAIIDAINEFLGEGEEAAKAETPKAGAFRTILFTDVEGSTALTDRLGDAKARELLREHERMVREALKAHGGSEVKTMGDGFMASFSSATKALECAIAMQRAFAEWNSGVGAALAPPQGAASSAPTTPIKVRIGLNAGEPIAEDQDLFGTAVNMAARIAGKAEGGEILASDVVRQLVAGKDFLFADRGETALRGFEDPVRVYELRWHESV